MTVSTYLEPVPVTPISDLPQIQETEENDEPSEFAKILAGLLAKSGMDEPAAGIMDSGIQSAEIKTDVDILAFEETGAEKNDLFGVMQKIENIEDAQIPDEHYSVLVSAEYLLDTKDVLIENETDIGDSVHELVKMESDFADLEPMAEFASLETAETAAAAQIPFALTEENLPVEADDKKEAGSVKTVKTEKSEKTEAHSVKDSSEESAITRRGEETALLKNKEPVKEAPTRLDEARSKNRRDKITFEVNDMRTETGSGAPKLESLRLNASLETRVQGDASVKEMTLELRLPEQSQTAAQATAQTNWEAKAGSALENMLARELHQNFNGDIVRHASMALRDGGEGTIRIALKPEALGNVKIHLEMAENKITGRIVVESEEALNAFRKEMDSLEQAFRDSGFTNADLNLSLAADGRNAQGQEQTESSLTPGTAALRYENSYEEQNAVSLVDVYGGQRRGSINMLA